MQDHKYLIWSSEPDYEQYREDLERDMPDESEDARREAMYDMNNDDLRFIREELSHRYDGGILVIADLDLWDGHRSGYREIPSGQLSECFQPSRDTLDIQWYVDEAGDLRCDDCHHDGTNHYLYRAWKDGVSETQKDRLRMKVYNGDFSRSDITRVTGRLGDEIGRVYGWTFPSHQREKALER